MTAANKPATRGIGRGSGPSRASLAARATVALALAGALFQGCLVSFDDYPAGELDGGTGDGGPSMANGAKCTSKAQCASGYCVDGYCCNTPCDGQCATCDGTKSASGVHGTCEYVLTCTDPFNECTGAAICSAGACLAACP